VNAWVRVNLFTRYLRVFIVFNNQTLDIQQRITSLLKDSLEVL